MRYLCEMAGVSEMTRGHHVDHIFPLARFGEHEEHKMMHYSNLQLLTSKENQSKSARLPTKDMAARVHRDHWPDEITEDSMLPDIYPASTPAGWRTRRFGCDRLRAVVVSTARVLGITWRFG